MKRNTLIFDSFWLILGLGFLFLFFGSDHTLLNPDESRYSEIAREMLATGDFITPRLNGLIFFDKPVLYYWLQALSIHWFGLNEWALRFFPAIYGVFGCLCVYLLGSCIGNRQAGIYSALLLASSPLYFFAAHYANMDLEVAVLITASLTCFLLAINSKNAKCQPWLFYLAYLFSGLAILTKGLIGIVFPTIIVGTWIVCTNRWYMIKQMRLCTGLLLVVAINLPWFYAVQRANPNFFHYFFVVQHFERFLTANFNSQSPIWFYVPVVLLGVFPWTFLIMTSFITAIKSIKHNPNILFLLLWIGWIFIFFSIPKSKLIGYILPTIPPLMVVAGNYLANYKTQASRWILRLNLVSYLGIMIALLYLPQLAFWDSNLTLAKPIILLVITLGIIVVIVAYCNWRASLHTTWHFMIAGTFASLLVMSLVLPLLPLSSTKPLIQRIQAIKKPDDKLVSYFHYFYDLPLYAEQIVTIVANWEDPAMRAKDNWRRIFLYGLDYATDSKQYYIKPEILWRDWHNPERLFVFMRKIHLDFFKAQVSPVVIIADDDTYIVISNQP